MSTWGWPDLTNKCCLNTWCKMLLKRKRLNWQLLDQKPQLSRIIRRLLPQDWCQITSRTAPFLIWSSWTNWLIYLRRSISNDKWIKKKTSKNNKSARHWGSCKEKVQVNNLSLLLNCCLSSCSRRSESCFLTHLKRLDSSTLNKTAK